jgi:hypothetical protein
MRGRRENDRKAKERETTQHNTTQHKGKTRGTKATEREKER